MIPSPVPRELEGLTQIEKMLIARELPIMRVYVKPGGERLFWTVNKFASEDNRISTVCHVILRSYH